MKPRKWMIALVLLTILATLGASQAAQVNFLPELLLSQTYSDNIFLNPDDEEDDFITEVGVSLGGEVLWPTAAFSLNYTPSYNWFAQNSGEDFWRHAARLSAWKEYKRNTRFEFRNSFLYTQDPLDSSDVVDADDPLSRPDIESDRNRRGLEIYYTNVSEARVSHRFGAEDQVFGGLGYSILREVDSVAEDENSDENDIWVPFVGFAYWFNVRWGIEGNGLYSHRDFKDRNDREEYTGNARLIRQFSRQLGCFVDYQHTYLDFDLNSDEPPESDYNVYAPSAGIRYQIEENALITIGFGYLWQRFEDNDISDDQEIPFVNSEIYKTWPFRKGFVTLLGGSGYGIDDTGSEDLGLNIYYEGRATTGYNFTTRMAGDLFAGYRWDDYPDEEPARTDKTISAGAGVNYQALRWMNMRLEYNFNDVNSDSDEYEYTENRVMFLVTLTPSQPYRFNR
jgi:hypothetical protein